jgi:hypothetical protein
MSCGDLATGGLAVWLTAPDGAAMPTATHRLERGYATVQATH